MLKNPRQLEEDLESDDELPSHYVETPDIPAYKNDSRFDTIHFPWIKKFLNKNKQETRDAWKPFLYSTLNEQTVLEKTKELNFGEKLLITEGILNQTDLICLKCIESNCSDSTLLWLLNFFMYKDLQSHYNFVRTCLVEKLLDETHDLSLDSFSKMHNFEIVLGNKIGNSIM